MRVFTTILSVLLVVAGARSLYLKHERGPNVDHLIRSWNNFREKLYTGVETTSYPEAGDNKQIYFDELEAISLIPTIIELFKKDLLLQSEQETLSQIYGNMWIMLAQEARRTPGTQINPLLKTIFDVIKFLNSKESLYTSDTDNNTIEKIPKAGFRKLNIEKFDDDQPAQRILNMAAVLIRSIQSVNKHVRKPDENDYFNEDSVEDQEQPSRRSRRTRSVKESKIVLNLELSNIPRKHALRLKRNVPKSSGSADVTSQRMDALLGRFLEEKGIIGYPMEDYFAIDENVNSDYAYDDNYEYDNGISMRNTYQSNYENGSFQDLILLAARNHLQSKKMTPRKNRYN